YPTQPTYARAFEDTFFTGNPTVARFLAGAGEGVGSNNWVVDGTLTASGKPLLANDPHLGTRLPSTWYLAHVKGGDFEMIGATLPPVEPLAFRWTALDPDDSTLASFLKVNEAHNWQEFTAALRDFVTPSQNFVYADVEGHIGYYAPGRIPIRAHGDGASPVE